MFNKRKKAVDEFWANIGDTPNSLFEEIALLYKNEKLVETFNFHKEKDWFPTLIVMTEKDRLKTIKRMKRMFKDTPEEDLVKDVGNFVEMELELDDLYFEIIFSKDVYLLLVNQKKEDVNEQTKEWAEFATIEDVFSYLRTEIENYIESIKNV